MINSIGGGGAERALDTILRAAGPRRDKYEMHLVLLDREREMRALPILDGSHCLDAGGRLFSSIVRLRRLLRRLQPDLVVSLLVRANVANAMSQGSWSAILCERMHIGSHLSGRYASWRLIVLRRLLRLAYARATLVLGVSKGVSDDLIANFGATVTRTLTINNPYDVDQIVSDGRKPPSIALPSDFLVAVGRLVDAKGFSDLIAAYAAGPRELPLLILGDGPERKTLEAQVARENLDGMIQMPGFVRDPFAVMSRARALVSASYNEGFPNAIAEAMALGVPVLATDCPSGPAELLQGAAGMAGSVSEGVCGLLVRTGDVAGLMNGIAVLRDSVTRARLAEAGRRRIEDFRIERVAEEYWRVFETYAARGATRARFA